MITTADSLEEMYNVHYRYIHLKIEIAYSFLFVQVFHSSWLLSALKHDCNIIQIILGGLRKKDNRSFLYIEWHPKCRPKLILESDCHLLFSGHWSPRCSLGTGFMITFYEDDSWSSFFLISLEHCLNTSDKVAGCRNVPVVMPCHTDKILTNVHT
jgi:hypothetical protein